jgi:hypothetical protein
MAFMKNALIDVIQLSEWITKCHIHNALYSTLYILISNLHFKFIANWQEQPVQNFSLTIGKLPPGILDNVTV